MSVRRLITPKAVRSLEMAAACAPVPTGKEKPLTLAVCGPKGREVIASGLSVAELEGTAAKALVRFTTLYGAVIEYTDAVGSVAVSRITPD